MLVEKEYEKVSFSIPAELKRKALDLKDEKKVSLNSMYRKALAEYIKKEEVKKWEEAAILASQDSEYQKLSKELGNVVGE